MTIVRTAEENTTKVKDGAKEATTITIQMIIMATEATTITIQMITMATEGVTINLIKIHKNDNK